MTLTTDGIELVEMGGRGRRFVVWLVALLALAAVVIAIAAGGFVIGKLYAEILPRAQADRDGARAAAALAETLASASETTRDLARDRAARLDDAVAALTLSDAYFQRLVFDFPIPPPRGKARSADPGWVFVARVVAAEQEAAIRHVADADQLSADLKRAADAGDQLAASAETAAHDAATAASAADGETSDANDRRWTQRLAPDVAALAAQAHTAANQAGLAAERASATVIGLDKAADAAATAAKVAHAHLDSMKQNLAEFTKYYTLPPVPLAPASAPAAPAPAARKAR